MSSKEEYVYPFLILIGKSDETIALIDWSVSLPSSTAKSISIESYTYKII